MKALSFGLFAVVAVSCNLKNEISVIGRYKLERVDGEQYTLGYQVNSSGDYLTLVDSYVFAAGYDDRYIVAIQHPKILNGISKDSNYFIIPINKVDTYTPEKGIMGPMTFSQYSKKKEELRLGELKWLSLY